MKLIKLINARASYLDSDLCAEFLETNVTVASKCAANVLERMALNECDNSWSSENPQMKSGIAAGVISRMKTLKLLGTTKTVKRAR